MRPRAASGLTVTSDSLMETIASKPLGPVRKDRLSLSSCRVSEFCERSDDVGDMPHAGALHATLDDLRGSAVFRVQHIPTVVVLSADDPLRRGGGAG